MRQPDACSLVRLQIIRERRRRHDDDDDDYGNCSAEAALFANFIWITIPKQPILCSDADSVAFARELLAPLQQNAETQSKEPVRLGARSTRAALVTHPTMEASHEFAAAAKQSIEPSKCATVSRPQSWQINSLAGSLLRSVDFSSLEPWFRVPEAKI